MSSLISIVLIVLSILAAGALILTNVRMNFHSKSSCLFCPCHKACARGDSCEDLCPAIRAITPYRNRWYREAKDPTRGLLGLDRKKVKKRVVNFIRKVGYSHGC